MSRTHLRLCVAPPAPEPTARELGVAGQMAWALVEPAPGQLDVARALTLDEGRLPLRAIEGALEEVRIDGHPFVAIVETQVTWSRLGGWRTRVVAVHDLRALRALLDLCELLERIAEEREERIFALGPHPMEPCS